MSGIPSAQRLPSEDGNAGRGRTMQRRSGGRGGFKHSGPPPDQVPIPEALSDRGSSSSASSSCKDISVAKRESQTDAELKSTMERAESSEPTLSQEASSDAEAIPSVGSLLHQSGRCTPCQRWIKKRCTRGESCEQCHIRHLEVPKANRNRPGKRARDRRDKTRHKIEQDVLDARSQHVGEKSVAEGPLRCAESANEDDNTKVSL